MSKSTLAVLAGLVAAAALVGCGKKPEQAAVTGPAAAPAAGPAAEEKVVNVFNWSDYIDPATLEAFTAEQAAANMAALYHAVVGEAFA